ncbi:MAG TPA: hypothetical protein VND64_33575 [Pirellulales bacterium]|nr:hypothetical protein [Pirellulales bacterium]
MRNRTAKARRSTNKQKFPRGWNEQRVQKVLAHYENQTEYEAVAEDEAQERAATITIDDLVAAKRLVGHVGSIEKVREALAALARLG